VQVVKMVVASAVNEKGKQTHPREWNEEFIDLPVVSKKKQRCPTFSGDVVTGILSKTKKEKYRRFGEGLGIDIKNISPDCSTIKIIEKAWRGERQRFLKTESGEREVDIHPSVAAMLREYIGERKSGLLFASKSGRPFTAIKHLAGILRRTLHPILAELSQPKCGAHAFRRFRNAYLRNYALCPEGLRKFWLGWSDQDMSDLYDKIREDDAFRKEWAEKAGVGYTIPAKPVSKTTQLVYNGPQNAVAVEREKVA